MNLTNFLKNQSRIRPSNVLFVGLLFLLTSLSYGQTNLLDLSTWVAGDSQLSNFPRNGSQSENVRETGIVDPRGNTNTIVWKSINDAANDADGGWHTPNTPNIDHTKSYRFTVWIKKTGSNDGYTLFGIHARNSQNQVNTLNLDGTVNPNPYFSGWTDPPALDEWFLYVGYLHASNYSGGNIGGIYNTDGEKVRDLMDFKMPTTTTMFNERVYLYYDTNTADIQYFFEPTIYQVNGQEPSIEELINPDGGSGGGGGGSGLWTTNTNGIHYSDGNVGIGTTSPITKLDVNGPVSSRHYIQTFNPNNEEAAISLSWLNDVARIRIGGNGAGASSGMVIQGPADTDLFRVMGNGNVGIGTEDPGTEWKLAVNGKIRSKEIKVETGWSDYVFEKDYPLPSLKEVEQHIAEKGHLINIPSAAEVEANGIELGHMNSLLLEKIEELTLYILEQDKKQKQQDQKQEQLEQRINQLENQN